MRTFFSLQGLILVAGLGVAAVLYMAFLRAILHICEAWSGVATAQVDEAADDLPFGPPSSPAPGLETGREIALREAAKAWTPQLEPVIVRPRAEATPSPTPYEIWTPPEPSPAWTVESLPNPAADPEPCGMRAPSRLCDPDSYLDVKEREQVQRALDALGEVPRVPGCERFEMGVVVVRSIQGEARKFARAVIDNWGIGDQYCNNGIVLVLAIQDHLDHMWSSGSFSFQSHPSLYLATGKGAREFMTKARAKEIVDRIAPMLIYRISDAVEYCVSDVLHVLKREDPSDFASAEESNLSGFVKIWLGISLFMVSQYTSIGRLNSIMRRWSSSGLDPSLLRPPADAGRGEEGGDGRDGRDAHMASDAQAV